MVDQTKTSISLDKFTIDKIDKHCGEGKEFRSRASFIRYATERFLDYLEGTIIKDDKE